MFKKCKRIIAVLCIAIMTAVCLAPAAQTDVHGASLPSLTDKSIYYLGDNVAGGLCLVSSNTFMLKRMAIILGSSKWNTITLSEINSKGIKYKEYYYTNDGYTYHTNKYTKFTTQTVDGVTSQLIQLLKDRPEGVIIYGDKAQDNDAAAGKAADHGILITEYRDGTFYGIDPSHNRNGKSKGIEKLSDTTIVTLKGITHYMCIQDISYNENATSTTSTTSSSSSSNAASTLKITDYSTPSTLMKGQAFTVKGTVKSNYNISKVTVSVIDSNGKTKISKSGSPNSKSYSLSKLDNSIKFGTLGTGTFTYKVTAKDSKKSSTLVSKKFKVQPQSTLKIKDARYPSELKKGKSFTIKGKVTSNYNLKKVTVGVYTTSGKAKTTASKSLSGKKSYSIQGLDSKIKFGKLEKGTYYFKVIAKDSKKTKTVLNKKFTVK